MANPWDVSNILLSNQAGARMGAGIASFGGQIGGALQQAVMMHRDKKKEVEANDAAVQWLKKKGPQYFKDLDVSDDGELKAVVKAAGGGRQAIQMIAGLEAQQQAAAAAEQQRQIQAAQLAEMERAKQTQLRSRGAAQLAAGGAPRGAELEAMIMAGDQITSSRMGAATPDSAVLDYLSRTGDAAGAGNIADTYTRLEQLRAEREQFKPELVDLGNGVTGMTTSRRSAIPVQKGEAAKPLSPQGRLMADADALERAGRKDDAAALRKVATSARASGNKPMSATDWILTGGDPAEYRSYVEGFTKSTDAGVTASPGAEDVNEISSPEEFNRLPKGARFRFNGKTGIKL